MTLSCDTRPPVITQMCGHGVGITCLNYHGRGTLADYYAAAFAADAGDHRARKIIPVQRVAPASSPKPAYSG